MKEAIGLLKVVALLKDVPGKSLLRGQVETVVEQLSDDAWEVEFCDSQGRTFAQCALKCDQLMLLRHAPAQTV